MFLLQTRREEPPCLEQSSGAGPALTVLTKDGESLMLQFGRLTP